MKWFITKYLESILDKMIDENYLRGFNSRYSDLDMYAVIAVIKMLRGGKI